MRISFVIYDGMTALDFIGVYDPLTRLKTMNLFKDLYWEVCALDTRVRDSTGLPFTATRIDRPLTNFDMLIIPGGPGSRHLVGNRRFIAWLQSGRDIGLKASVCRGSLLLGGAGFLKGKRATCHPHAYELLAKYCSAVVTDRIVDEGDVITARGVTASIDLGLYLCEKIAGRKVKEIIRQRMDYPYVAQDSPYWD